MILYNYDFVTSKKGKRINDPSTVEEVKGVYLWFHFLTTEFLQVPLQELGSITIIQLSNCPSNCPI